MTKQQAERLERKINKTSGYRVTGWRVWRNQGISGRATRYELDVVCTETGDPFVVSNPSQWE